MESNDLAAKGQKKVPSPTNSLPSLSPLMPPSPLQLQLFLAKGKTSAAQAKPLEASAVPAFAAAAAVPDFAAAAADHGALTASCEAPPAPAAAAAAAAAPPASPIARSAPSAPAFSSPLSCPSPAAHAAAETALLSTQVADLRRRLAECERDRDAAVNGQSVSARDALEAAACARLELQGVRDQCFEECEALRFQYQQMLDDASAEVVQLQQSCDAFQAEKVSVEQRLLSAESKLADAISRLATATEDRSQQALLLREAKAREDDLQRVVALKTQEASTLELQLSAALAAVEQRERELQESIASERDDFRREFNALQTRIASLSAELEQSRSSASCMQQELDAVRSFHSQPSEQLELQLQELTQRAAVSLSKAQSESSLKDLQLASTHQQLSACQAALSECSKREQSLNLQIQALQSARLRCSSRSMRSCSRRLHAHSAR
jgi:chromosome segregation ATPase